LILSVGPGMTARAGAEEADFRGIVRPVTAWLLAVNTPAN
jgi:hypothetical protein